MSKSSTRSVYLSHLRCARNRMITYLKSRGIKVAGVKQKALITLFFRELGMTCFIGKVSLRDQLVDLYRSGSCEHCRADESGFYSSVEWLALRKRVLRVYKHICMKCGNSDDIIHIDHIKPRSLYPKLALEFENLQVLCRCCNIRKSNREEVDYRTSGFLREII